jgi:hypothetical protein
MPDFNIFIPKPHVHQDAFVHDVVKRKVIKAGRRGGKTVGMSILAVEQFLAGKRVLYATPTAEQIDRFWKQCNRALQEPIDAKVFYKNETEHIIELLGTEQRIKAKTAWNADTLRGDYADVLILDEFQLMNEDTWGTVGAPMMFDNNGDAVFCFTVPSVRAKTISKASDKKHANKMWKRAYEDKTGRWRAYHFTSMDNPYISQEAVQEIINSTDMTRLAIRQEIYAEDVDEVAGALWKQANIDQGRTTLYPDLFRIGVGVDPHASSGQTGLIVAGIAYMGGEIHAFVLEDGTRGGLPNQWAGKAIELYDKYQADIMVGEVNHGGDMIWNTISNVDGGQFVNFKAVRASRGKYVRAEPISALYGDTLDDIASKVHHVGVYSELEEQMCSYVPGDPSPNNMDALVWILTELMLGDVESGDFGMGKVEEYENKWA